MGVNELIQIGIHRVTSFGLKNINIKRAAPKGSTSDCAWESVVREEEREPQGCQKSLREFQERNSSQSQIILGGPVRWGWENTHSVCQVGVIWWLQKAVWGWGMARSQTIVGGRETRGSGYKFLPFTFAFWK